MKEIEFEKLVQGSLSVAEYEAKFTRLQRFALGLVATEKMRADRFFEGLIYPIKQRLSSLAYTTMAEVIRAATRDERIYKSQYGIKTGNQKEVKNKEDQKKVSWQKEPNQQFQKMKPYEKKKGEFSVMKAMQGQQGEKLKTCFLCGQPGHMKKDCPNIVQANRPNDNYVCYTCGQLGHWRRDCPMRGQQPNLPAPPQRPALPPPARQQGQQRGPARGGQRGTQQQQQGAFVAAAVVEPATPVGPVAPVVPVKAEGKMFAATVAEALAENEVVTGTLLVASVPATVLFDSGCTHSFMSHVLASRISIPIEELGYPLVVTTPAGVVTSTGRCMRSVPIVIQQQTLVADLFLFQMTDFDIILGMDWMSRNGALIDCKKKKVYFRKGRRRFAFQGKGRDNGCGFVGYHKIRSYMERGFEMYMATLVSSSSKESNVASIPIVREFEDVFPSDVIGLPPEREVEFAIELVPGTTPISKAPYRMAPLEWNELREQLQTLLD